MSITARSLTAGANLPEELSAQLPGMVGLLAQIFTGPDLPGAACRGRGGPWDEAHDVRGGEQEASREDRHAAAGAICQGCPARDACRDARESDPTLGGGIWGGELHGANHRHGRCARCGGLFVRAAGSRQKYCRPDCDGQLAASTSLEREVAA